MQQVGAYYQSIVSNKHLTNITDKMYYYIEMESYKGWISWIVKYEMRTVSTHKHHNVIIIVKNNASNCRSVLTYHMLHIMLTFRV